MIKARVISITMLMVGILMLTVAAMIETNTNDNKIMKNEVNNTNIVNMSVANRIENKKTEFLPLVKAPVEEKQEVQEVSMEQAPQAEYIPPRIEVYEGMTMEELAEKLNRNLGTGVIAGKGNVIASKCIELGVDPYIATAIMLHETGCKSSCSRLVNQCNNVGGQKGAPACSGSYKGYATIDEGIIGHIENLYNRYYLHGLNTIETIGPRYAESNTWVSKIHYFVDQIRAS